MLDARRPPVWVVFVDIAGSRVRIRTAAIHGIEESTPEQRASARAFSDALSEEAEEEEKGSDGWR
jgi:hypothetical protein